MGPGSQQCCGIIIQQIINSLAVSMVIMMHNITEKMKQFYNCEDFRTSQNDSFHFFWQGQQAEKVSPNF